MIEDYEIAVQPEVPFPQSMNIDLCAVAVADALTDLVGE